MGRISPYHHFQNQTPGTSQGLVSSRHVLVTYSVSLENSEIFGGAQYISPTGLAEVVVIESYVRQAELHALSPAQEFLREQHVTPPLYVSCHSVPVSFSKEHRTGICTKEGIESVRPVRTAIPIAPILLQLLHNCLLPSLIFLIKFKSGPKDSKHLEEKKRCLKPNTENYRDAENMADYPPWGWPPWLGSHSACMTRCPLQRVVLLGCVPGKILVMSKQWSKQHIIYQSWNALTKDQEELLVALLTTQSSHPHVS